MDSNFATHEDLKDLRQEMALGFSNIENKMIQVEQRMVIKLGTIISIAIAIAVTLTKLVK